MFSSTKKNVKATVVDSALIVSFPSAGEPRVWRIDLGKFLSTALEIRESLGKFSLMMKTSGGQAEEVGTFTNKKKAVEAMQEITEALLRGKEAPPPPKSGGFLKFLKFILIVLLIVFATGLIWSMTHPQPSVKSTANAPPVKTGVPVPADELFGK